MVYVLGVLTLVALIGLILIAGTHGEFKRVKHESTASSGRSSMNGIVRTIQETLHRDVWGRRPIVPGMVDVPLADDDAGPIEETNEPFDAPGPDDRWLASIQPYYLGAQATGWNPGEDLEAAMEEHVLAWHWVSYLGTDVILPEEATNAFRWRFDSRTHLPRVADAYAYGDHSLTDVSILQTPPPPAMAVLDSCFALPEHAGVYSGGLIPGSTTNVSIAEARDLWLCQLPELQTDLADMGLLWKPRFPYFDTNADGEVDLYDADGDGVPDSPISFIVQQDPADPNEPEQLYAAIRIIDHGGMLNTNVASSMRLTDGGLTFAETVPDLQRRGRRLTELLLNDVIHADDGPFSFTGIDRVTGLMAYRSGDDPVAYDVDVVRRGLVGGSPVTDPSYFLYGLGDEASLRHRNLLVPYDFRDYIKTENTGDYRTIDRALRWSLLWTREEHESHGFSYLPDESRWNRFNADYEPEDTAVRYEGYDDEDAGLLGWRTLLREDDPAAIRRQMFTTISHEVVPPPTDVRYFDNGTLEGDDDFVVGQDGLQLLSSRPVRFPESQQPDLNRYMMWPTIGRTMDPDVPDWMRVQPIDINMSEAGTNPVATKRQYICQLAAAMYTALGGTSHYQDIPLPPGSMNRDWLAWQFALNMADYRDSDNDPTVIQLVYGPDPDDPLVDRRYMFGVERQPFFTEAFAYLLAGSGPPGEVVPTYNPDDWFFAVELFVPPQWRLAIDHLYIRTPGVSSPAPLIPLDEFLKDPDIGLPAILDGGPAGSYFVLCGDTSHPPSGHPGPFPINDFYQNSSFEIAIDGFGRVELVYWANPADPTGIPPLVLDAIGPGNSGGPPADGTPTGEEHWAKRPDHIREGSGQAFSLLRSTQGWRFTTAWHVFTMLPQKEYIPTLEMQASLGDPNSTSDSLDNNIPESIWPAMTPLATAPQTDDNSPLFIDADGDPVFGFSTGLPYEAFDSVGDISRMLMIGPVVADAAAPPYLPNFDHSGGDMPVTVMLGEILDTSATGDLLSEINKRVAAGRVDFFGPFDTSEDDDPWTWRLFSYLTTQSLLYDGIDNDGDDTADLGHPDPALAADPTEGADVFYRVAGRININTAPLSVLRAVPYMSLLPTSAEFQQAFGVVTNPKGVYDANDSSFWDFASAIVARREDRHVPLRMMDSLLGVMTPVAEAAPWSSSGGPGPGSGGDGGTEGPAGPFKSIAELASLGGHKSGVIDVNGNDSLFQIERFLTRPGLALWNHKRPGSTDPDLGDADDEHEAWGALSPDYRYRNDNGTANYIPVGPATNFDVGGIRGRDIFLARWANLLTTRSDVFTAYIVLIDEDGNTVQRAQLTLDRSECFREDPETTPRFTVLPKILHRTDGSYGDDMR